MPRQRIVVSVTWDKCDGATPHLGELTIFTGTEEEADKVMRQNHYFLFGPREFRCVYCRLLKVTAPTALIIEDTKEEEDASAS